MNTHDLTGSSRHRRAALAALLTAGLALTAAVPAPAAEAKPGAAFADTTQPGVAFADTARPVLFLKETVVTGTRYPRVYFESPQALSFIGRTQLRESAPIVIGDILGTLPGVDNSKDSPWEQRPIVRGLSGQRVLVLMDGVPMNSARGNGPHPSLVDPSQIERVEVVRGPSSVSYGSDAIGGVINIITREAPAATSGLSITGAASLTGSTAERQGGGSIELAPRIGKFGAFLSTGFRSAKDFESPVGTVPTSAFDDFNSLVNVRYDFTERMSLKGGYQMYRGSDIGIPGLSSPTASYPPGMTSVFHFKNYDRDLAHLALDHRYDRSWIASSLVKVYWQAERRNFFSTEQIAAAHYADLGVFGAPAASTYRQTDQDRFLDLTTLGTQIQFSSVKTERYFFAMGVDAGRDHTDGDNVRRRGYHFDTASGDSAGTVTTRVTAPLPEGDFDNYAMWWQNQMFFGPQWTASGGLRWTEYRYHTEAGLSIPASGPVPAVYFPEYKVNQSKPCGSLGIVYAPQQDLRLSFNLANGYRQPTAQELFFKGAASVGFVIGNPELKPEQSVSMDTGLRWSVGGLALSGNLFYSTFTDMIDAINVPSVPEAAGQPTYQYKNIAKARMWGGEAEGEWAFREGWRARATATGAVGDIIGQDAIFALYGVNAETAPLPSVPPFHGTFGVRWTESGGRGWVEGSSRYAWRTNRLGLPVAGVSQIGAFKAEWIAFDIMSGCRFGKGQRALIGVRNVADMRYRQAFGSLDEPGRSFVATLSSSF